MNIKLLPSVKLPYQMTQGSMAQRSEKALDFVLRLGDETLNIAGEKTINREKLQTVMNKLLPEHISVKVIKYTEDYLAAASDVKSNGNLEATDLTMELSFLNNEVPIEQIIDVVHEGRHIADELFNPKYLARQQTLEQKYLFTRKYLDFYDDQLYIQEYAESERDIKDTIKIIKRKLHDVLRRNSVENKINIIQNLRYGLETEKNAFKTQFEFGEKYRKAGLNLDKEYYSGYEEYLFDEKIAMLKQTAFEIIQKARADFARNLKKNKKSRSAKSAG